MLRRLCKLCQIVETPAIKSLRIFSTATVRRLEEEAIEKDVFADDFLSHTSKEPEVVVKSKRKPIIHCRDPKLHHYYGTTYPKFQEIPIASKNWMSRKSKGDYFTVYPTPVKDDSTDNYDLENTYFSDIKLDSRLVANLKKWGYEHPTKIQLDAIPQLLSGQNVIITAETGCGKTFAYLIPIVQQILKWKKIGQERNLNTPYAVIIAASRELTAQIGMETKKLTKDLDIDVQTIVGGRTTKIKRNPPIRNVDILIGTVGVLCKMTTWKIYKLDHVYHTVLDEAHALFDEMYDDKLLSFLKKIKFGFRQPGTSIPTSSQLILASATMPETMPDYLEEVVDVNSIINLSTPNTHRVLVPQKFWRLGALQKPYELLKLVKSRALQKAPTLIFCRNAATSDWIAIFLNSMNVKAIALNGQMPAVIRKDRYGQFKRGEVHILSTTDSAARGLDTTMVDLVINYDFPASTADYVHRCGRTGRLGGVQNGRIINFISRKYEIELTQKIERIARRGRAIPMFNIIEAKENISVDQELKMLLERS
ncbi:probable ATP-dependent RNA helicase DDX28 [Chelonus insularis]|uniref:probable ATP-dependent RNA helicase DDX28 n=1 Tax=Chelonus insularis TaxID=460826 RepID=UPI00158BFCD6|nr:probable ATP-dependent RNA helicase DDX28 [Chelonus insularis]